MFDESLVVQSAISAFNNAALVAPTFFWTGLLAVPLMMLAYFYGADFMRRIGWQLADLRRNAAGVTIVTTLLWMVMFGGNYDVLRDAGSVLPYGVAAVVFACSMLVGAGSRGVALPKWRGATWRRRALLMICVALVLFMVGMSGMHTWWGILMQIAAFSLGVVFGRLWRRVDAPVGICMGVMLAVATLMLMQPEFFRFGQLGRLSFVHMAALIGVGGTIAAAVALCVIRPCGAIYHSAYVKLKWMLRFVAALAIVLFWLTESVPVFLGAVAVMFIMFAMSVWHAAVRCDDLWGRFFALALMLFGLITTLPVISAVGVMVWAAMPRDVSFSGAKFLL